MYRTGKGNFLTIPPQNQTGGTTSKPLQPSQLFERIGNFHTLHPKKAIFDGFYTDFEEFSRKISFWEIFAEISHAVRCPSISKKPVEICGGDIRSKSDSKEGNFFSRYPVPLYQYKKTDIAVETP